MALASAGSLTVRAAETSGFTFEPVAGTSVIWRPYVETEVGYDSNLDSEVGGPGSRFEKLETGASLKALRDNQTYLFNVMARNVHFDDLAVDDRWEVKASADATIDLTTQDTLNATVAYHRDFFSIDRADIYTSDVEYARRTEDYRLRVQARSTIEKNIGGNFQATNEPLDEFLVSRNKAFDFSRTEGYLSLLTFTRNVIQPYAIYDLSTHDYFSQVSNPLLDRNAFQQYGIAGLRFQPHQDFRIDIGARVNHRDFEDRITTDFSSAHPDINMFWQPMDTVKVTALLERTIKEPSTAFGLADDVRTVGMTFDWNINKVWLLSLAGYYDRVEAIGENLKFDKYLSTAYLTYFPNDHVEVFLTLLGKWSDEEVQGDDYDRYKSGLGARIKF